MNIYEKLQNIRVDFLESNIKKSGKNKFTGFSYFELCDLIPILNKLMKKYKASSVISFDAEHASLALINSEKPKEQIIFKTPMAEANLKGCHPIQNLGAAQTYIRRYLYINAFDIVEHDDLDQDVGKKPVKPIGEADKKIKKIGSPQNTTASPPNFLNDSSRQSLIDEIEVIIDKDKLQVILEKKGVESLQDLPTERLNKLYEYIQQQNVSQIGS